MALFYIASAIASLFWTFALQQFVTIGPESDVSERLLKTLGGVFFALFGLVFFVVAKHAYAAEHVYRITAPYYFDN